MELIGYANNLFDVRDGNTFHENRISHQSLFIFSTTKNEIKMAGNILLLLLAPNNICWIEVSAREYKSHFVHSNHPFSPDEAARSAK
jgi:hypothetical protein